MIGQENRLASRQTNNREGPPALPASDKKRGMRRQSLRTQLIAWNVLTLAVLFAVFGGIIQFTVRSFMMASVERELAHRVQRLMGPPPVRPPGPPHRGENDDPLPPVGEEERSGPGEPDDRPEPRNEPPRPAPLPAGTERPPAPDENDPYRPQRYDLSGQPFGPRDNHALWDKQAFETAKQKRELYSTVMVEGEPYRVLSVPFPPEGPVAGVIQAPYRLAEVNQAVAELGRALLLLTPVGLLFAGLGGAFLTGRVLRRVRWMAQAAEQIGAKSFAARLPKQGNDEFSALADTFNALLGRQEAAYATQERALEQQRRFTADASHELKTPLTVIRGTASMALSGSHEEAVYRQCMQEIDQSAQTMAHLVQDLLLLARSDAGQLGRNRIELLVREVLERAMSAAAHTPHAPIMLDIDDKKESISRVMGNESELVRLFTNLLDNAIRYTPPDGRIAITARRKGANMEIRVTDTGSGIAPEHLAHLGERFYRAEESRSRPFGGTGLGLSICKGIAAAHQGTLTLESAPGIGTTVCVTLPAC